MVECAANAGVSDGVIEDLGAYELGPLRHEAVFKLKLRLPVAVHDVLNRAVTARNALAHLEPVDPVTLSSLAAAARTARFAPGPVR